MKRSTIIEVIVIGSLVGAAVYLVEHYATGGLASAWVWLLLVGIALFLVQLVFIWVRWRRGEATRGTPAPVNPAVAPRDPFQRELNWNWTGLMVPPDQTAESEQSKPTTPVERQ